MNQETSLLIRMTPGELKPRLGVAAVNERAGGPETLLRWLETQLGLPVAASPKANRITEYAAALDGVTEPVFAESLATDRWATVSELLARRDELLLAGWNEVDSDLLPQLVRDLARAAHGRIFAFPGQAARLQRVLNSLDAGQILPPHRCTLRDPIDQWPTLWRKVLERLNVDSDLLVTPRAVEGSSLRTAQTVIQGGPMARIVQDSTFRYLHARSATAAVEYVAGTLAAAPDRLSTTFICCEDNALALQLDACLRRLGLPTTGASAWSRAHPVLQVLPLTLALCWQPVDPQALLDFLTLPISPLPKKAALRLAKALATEPGLGSSRWDAVIEELCSEANDPDNELRSRLNEWLLCNRAPKGGEMASRLVRSSCSRVAQWAAGRAILLASKEDSHSELIEALQVAASQASLLGELAESQGATLSEPQLARLLEEAISNGVETKACAEADGGPVWVRSLADINGECDRLIWFGLGTSDMVGCRWSASQLQQLSSAGIDVEDGSKSLAALRSAEVRGYCSVKGAALAVLLPQDLDRRWHPLWLAIRGCFSERDLEHPPVLEDLIAAGDATPISPFVFDVCDSNVEPPQRKRLAWKIAPELFRDLETTSATELGDRLACPLKWTLLHQAKIRSSPIARLPDDHQLKGTFLHSILERVFGDGGALPAVEDAVAAVLGAFDERLPLDAAPLAQSHKLIERQRLRKQIANATRVLVGALAAGGYRIVGIEAELSGDAGGKPLIGWIDCLAARDNGDEAIIDFKYAGRSKFLSLIEEGKAVQLATYAFARSTARGKYPAVAYLVLSDGLLYTPKGSPIAGAEAQMVIDGPSIQVVWKQLLDALTEADGWPSADAPVRARPLQEPSCWPEGATMVLEPNLKSNQVQEVCRYCEYPAICGVQEIS